MDLKITEEKNIGNKLYFIGILFLQMSHTCMNIVFLSRYLVTIKLLGILLLICYFVINLKYKNINKNKVILLSLVTISGLISYILTTDTTIIELVIMAMASIGLDFNKVVKKDFIAKILILILIVSCYYLGYTTSDFTILRNGELRSSFGFYHPNIFGLYVMILFLEYIYIKRIKNIKLILAATFLAVSIDITANSRSAVLGIIVAALLLVWDKITAKILYTKVISFILKNVYVILSILSIGLTILFINNNDMAIWINKILSERLLIQAEFLEKYTLNLFGNAIDYTKTLDNGYIRYLLNYGIFAAILFAAISYSSIKKSIKNKNLYITIYMLIFLIYMMSEQSIFYIYFNIFLLYAFTEPDNKNKGIETNA